MNHLFKQLLLKLMKNNGTPILEFDLPISHRTDEGGGFDIHKTEENLIVKIYKPNTMPTMKWESRIIHIHKGFQGLGIKIRRIK